MGKTTNKELFEKEIQRIERTIKRAEKQGYIFDEDIVPKIPKRVTKKNIEEIQKITHKTIKEKAQNFNKAKLEIDVPKLNKVSETDSSFKRKTKAENTPSSTPKISVPKQPTGGKKKKKEKTEQEPKQRKTRSDKGVKRGPRKPKTETPSLPVPLMKFDEIVIREWKHNVMSMRGAKMRGTLIQWIDKLIADNGSESVAEMLQQGAENGIILTYEVCYNEEACYNYISDMVSYLQDQGALYKEEVMDLMQELEYEESGWSDIE